MAMRAEAEAADRRRADHGARCRAAGADPRLCCAKLVDEDRMGMLLISHDLAVVADMSDRITIMRNGEVMEAGETARALSTRRIPTRASWRRPRCMCRI
jgi:hypothetical protein